MSEYPAAEGQGHPSRRPAASSGDEGVAANPGTAANPVPEALEGAGRNTRLASRTSASDLASSASASDLASRTSASDSAAAARATAAGVKPRSFGSWYVAEHRIRSMKSYYQTLLATSLGQPFIYMLALGVGLATLVNQNLGPGGVNGVNYLAFVAPALLCTAAVMAMAEEATYPVMMGFKWNPIFYGMNAAPISGRQIVNGLLIANLVRIIPTCLIYYGVLLLFGAVPSALGIMMVPVGVLGGLAVGTPIMSYTSTIEEDHGQPAMLMRFLITPMFLFSGTFFPLTILPVYLQWIGWISPLWHATELGRVFSYGYSEPVWLSAVHVGYLVALTAVGWVISQRHVVRRLNK
jgi:lipooligosaccharide transport system permease protein